MKGLNKLALATAVAAAPFATQAMEPMNDSQMGDVTGQAGVTIELQTQVDIDQFSYTQDTAGSFVVDGIAVGGHDRDDEGNINSTFDASMDIDLLENGDALISFGGLHNTADGNPDGDVAPMLGFDFDRAGLEGAADAEATLMSDFTMDMYLTQLDIRASTEALAYDPTAGGDVDAGRTSEGGHLAIDVGFAMGMDVDVDVAAVGIRGLRMAGAEREVGEGEDAVTLEGTLESLQDGDVAAAAGSNPAVVNMTISAGTPIGSYSGLDQPDEALIVNVDNFQADMWIDDLRIGSDGGDSTNRSIGSIGLENLQVTNTRLAVYGRSGE